MAKAQTKRCRRCGGDLGAGSQQGVCLDCIKKLQAAKRARDSGRRRGTAAAAKADSSRRESVRTLTCVDCGERFFDVDLAAKRVSMVDGQPVCTACLKKRGGLGLVTVFVGTGVVALALLVLYPAIMLVALMILAVIAVITGGYYDGWQRNTRLMIVGIGLVAFVLCLYIHGFVREGQRRRMDKEAMEPYYKKIEKAIEEEDRDRIDSLLVRARKAAEALYYPKKHKARVKKLVKKARMDLTPEGMSDYDAGHYLALVRKLPRKKRWGHSPISNVTHKDIEGMGEMKHVFIEFYPSEKYDPDDARSKSDFEAEINTIFLDLMQRTDMIAKVTVTLFTAEDGEPEELDSMILTRQGFKDWRALHRGRASEGYMELRLLDFCGDPPPRIRAG